METFEGHISMTTPMVTPHLPAVLVQMLLEQGLSAHDLFEGTGVVLEHFSQPQHLFSYQQLSIIIARGLQLTGNPRLGFEFGKRIRHAHMAELGVALSCVPDMETGYQIMRRYQKILGSAFNLRRVDHPNYVALIANKLIPLGSNYHFNQESWLVSLAYNLSRGLERPLHELDYFVEFDYPEPEDSTAFRELFGDKVRFSQKHSQILVARELTRIPLVGSCPTYLPAAMEACEEACQRSLRPISLPERIRSHLRNLLEAPPTADEVASHFNMSTRTLNRRLEDLDLHFRQLLKEVKFDMASQLLRTTDLPIGLVAQRSGFTEASNFVKAFREWAGTTPSRYRAQLRSPETL
ncbi:AraC family transcriptional regulator ligand-binding domain-containing protein [Pseudomonas sp. UL073]|uniref:AraC family transcriptional regulator ligand-binding domain-containing protein n=1 Tax=Zestomonas insulae TaxID=2809017 RepID=A0ABS2IFS2_9GAMM|nr:AraC family transcriptional regulator [Pseudomonas insulae]MBM7060678.1 AraC family transcriptional regulator ligand-binding domain-containing protein [Pseudomonas insulae]